jgi:hypothetical protein
MRLIRANRLDCGLAKTFLLTAAAAAASACTPMGLRGGVTTEWPQRFLHVDGTDHNLVVLYGDGTAAFSGRTARPESNDAYYTTAKARWRWCDRRNRPADRCILVDVSGYDGREEASFFCSSISTIRRRSRSTTKVGRARYWNVSMGIDLATLSA